MREERIQGQISILKCPKFWGDNGQNLNLMSNFIKGQEKIEIEWGNLYNNDDKICK